MTNKFKELREKQEYFKKINPNDTLSFCIDAHLPIKDEGGAVVNECDLRSIYIPPGATRASIASALGVSPSAIDDISSLQQGHWYLANITQEYGQPLVVKISPKPTDVDEDTYLLPE